MGQLDLFIKILTNKLRNKSSGWGRKAKKRNSIAANKIQFEVLNMGKYMPGPEGSDVDYTRLCYDIREENPNALVLGFCHTNVSDLNAIFSSNGIYSILALQNDRMLITGRKR